MGDDGTYSFGDSALICLKDLRKWLKFADGRMNRRDVARCMAEANLVKGDLLEILAKISPTVVEDKWRHKVAVATRKPGFGCAWIILIKRSRTHRTLNVAIRDRPSRSDRKPPSTWPLHTTSPDWLQAGDFAVRPRQNPPDCRQDRFTLNGGTSKGTNTPR